MAEKKAVKKKKLPAKKIKKALKTKNPVNGKTLKDFFIPHAGNNYKPKSLHHKRIFFHIGAALAVKLVVIASVTFYPMTAWLAPDVSAEEGRKIIASTNSLRAGLSLDSLKENQKLDQAAVKKIGDMFLNQYFAHTSPQNHDLEYFLRLAGYKNYVTVGENLAVGFDNSSEVMTAWKNSPTHYSNLVDPNYKEIGVALAGGTYKDQDTVFIAQYFGLPQENSAPVVAKIETRKPVEKPIAPGEKAVLAEKTNSTPAKVAVAKPVVVPAQAAQLTIDKPAGVKTDNVVKVEAILPADTKSANLDVLNTNVAMAPTDTVQANGDSTWTGQAVIQDDNTSSTPPIITVNTNAGEVQKLEVTDNNIKPQKTSIAAQYFLFKNHPNDGLMKIFDISSIYFKVILGLAILSLMLKIFIEIRRQHYKLIMSGLGLVAFLVIMIVF